VTAGEENREKKIKRKGGSDGSGLEGLLTRAHALIKLLQESNVAHNVLISPKSHPKPYPSDPGPGSSPVAVYIIPRKNQAFNNSAVCEGVPLKFAALELCGIILARSHKQFQTLRAVDIERELSCNVCLDSKKLEHVLKRMKEMDALKT